MYECDICGLEEATQEGGACFFCFYTGRYFEKVLLSDERSNMLEKIRALEHVVRAEIWHQRDGEFVLAIGLEDGRTLFPGVAIGVTTVVMTEEGSGEPMQERVVHPAIPPLGMPWGIAVMPKEAESYEDVIVMHESFSTDDELVEAIKQVSTLNALLDG